jgi:3-oxoacyl-[acyl-carrier-protein] synthase III
MLVKAGEAMIRSKITGTGSAVPDKILSNFDLEKIIDTSDEWIVSRTGIRERRIASEGEYTSTFAAQAAERAMAMAGVTADQIDLIILATITGDYPWPATACIVQGAIKAVNAVAFDISAACSGFVYALTTADRFIRTGGAKKALVIGAEVLTRIMDYTDRNTCLLFGDGAGAVVLEAVEGEEGVYEALIRSDGNYVDILYQPGYGNRNPGAKAKEDDHLAYLNMQGNEIFKLAVRAMEEASVKVLEMNGLKESDLSLLIPHQANKRIIDAIAKRLALPDEKVYVNLDRFGNTSAASIPIALDEANRNNRIAKGDLIMFVAFGGGLTWGAVPVRW